ncbi:hypothetical protein V5O48_010015 [Marasmius crinis-equi]|uniref:Protein RER1 n=1 Tax=Marasmius crinis-equi TaxID=585013 RepID=A0ABR3F9K3_9AGAR
MDTLHVKSLVDDRRAIGRVYAENRAGTGVVYWFVENATAMFNLANTLLALAFSCSVCYAHAIYLLNLLLAFLQPRFDPSLQEDLLADEIEGGGDTSPLPSQRDDEFRPFVRRLPEWQFWLSATRATVIALFCTTSEVFDVPVYWPILVVYFFTLFALTMRRQIQYALSSQVMNSPQHLLHYRHMIKYRYVPFDIGRKAKYGSKK